MLYYLPQTSAADLQQAIQLTENYLEAADQDLDVKGPLMDPNGDGYRQLEENTNRYHAQLCILNDLSKGHISGDDYTIIQRKLKGHHDIFDKVFNAIKFDVSHQPAPTINAPGAKNRDLRQSVLTFNYQKQAMGVQPVVNGEPVTSLRKKKQAKT